MRIAVLFDGAGLARLGLEQAGHDCVGFELDPIAHYLGQYVGSGRTILGDATAVDLRAFDAVWASPPCQAHSDARAGNEIGTAYASDLLSWSLALPLQWPHLRALWVENVPKGIVWNLAEADKPPPWGALYNAAQFLPVPCQNRNRMIGGHYPEPHTFHPWRKTFPGVCPTITASEIKGGYSPEGNKRRAAKFYGRRLTLAECGFHQGFPVPEAWIKPPPGWKPYAWNERLYRAIGNGVPVYMARAFGVAAQ